MNCAAELSELNLSYGAEFFGPQTMFSFEKVEVGVLSLCNFLSAGGLKSNVTVSRFLGHFAAAIIVWPYPDKFTANAGNWKMC